MRYTGTKSIGIRTPIIHEGDDITEVVVNSLKNAQENGEITIGDNDVISVTESVVARAQGNYVSVDDVASDVNRLFFTDVSISDKKELAVVFPIMSRNRFSIILKGIARACDKVYVLLKSPCDEVGNNLINIHTNEVLDDEYIYSHFDYEPHRFTGVDYMKLYRDIIEKENCEAEILVSMAPIGITAFCTNILCADIHTRNNTKIDIENWLMQWGCINSNVFTLADICCDKTNKHGYNEQYGLLGSNKMSEDTLKLFPNNCNEICYKIQNSIFETFGKNVEVLVYGDGAFKDPVCGIWELADPVVGAGYTDGLIGTPNELKLKYLADNTFGNLKGENAINAIKNAIKEKDSANQSLVGSMATQGTTPRQYTDLLGSLSDLTSGSGDKGTPVVLIQGYFDNYSVE